jgi:hypothetical protein
MLLQGFFTYRRRVCLDQFHLNFGNYEDFVSSYNIYIHRNFLENGHSSSTHCDVRPTPPNRVREYLSGVDFSDRHCTGSSMWLEWPSGNPSELRGDRMPLCTMCLCIANTGCPKATTDYSWRALWLILTLMWISLFKMWRQRTGFSSALSISFATVVLLSPDLIISACSAKMQLNRNKRAGEASSRL